MVRYGTHDSLLEASSLISTIEKRQGLKIGCIEEIAYKKGFINRDKFIKKFKNLNSSYSDYLKVNYRKLWVHKK